MKLDSKIYLTAKERKVFLIDIGVWILILIKIYQIIEGSKILMNKTKNDKTLISLCVIGGLTWFLFFIINASQYTPITTIESIDTLLLLSGVGLYILVTGSDCVMLKYVYSYILVGIGTIDALIDLTSIGNSSFDDKILLISIICEVFYIIVGVKLFWKNEIESK